MGWLAHAHPSEPCGRLPSLLSGCGAGRIGTGHVTRLRRRAGGLGWRAGVAAAERCLKPMDVFRDCENCPEMVVIPAGSFTMGSPANEGDRDDDEGPQHDVTIAKPFAVGKFEVMVGEYAAFVKATGMTPGAAAGFGTGPKQRNRKASPGGSGLRTSRRPPGCLRLLGGCQGLHRLARQGIRAGLPTAQRS